MPGRTDTFVKGEIYHIFNRTIDVKRIFEYSRLCEYFLEALFYYRSSLIDRSYSQFRLLNSEVQEKKKKAFCLQKYLLVEVYSYCLMPTHFHILLYERTEGGIQKVMSNVINSLTRYQNTRQNRKGPLFLPRFQSRHIVSDEMLLHVSRYQHLNPYSSGLVNTLAELEDYPWSSYTYYVSIKKSNLVNTDAILTLLNNNKESYKGFTEDRAEYQRILEELKYLEKWET